MDKKILNQNEGSSDSSIVGNNKNYHNSNQLQNGSVSTNSSDTSGGYCTVCRKPSVCVCSRCGDYYCSPECQRRDWQSHRYICFPMPSLVYPPSLNADALREASDLTLFSPNRYQQQQQEQQQQQMHNVYYDSSVRSPPMNGDAQHSSNQQQQQQQQQQLNKRNGKPQSGGGGVGHQITPRNCPLPANNSHVVLMGFRSPNRCYVRPFTPSDDEAFMLFVKKVDTYGKSAPQMTIVPQTKSFAISHLNGVMCRVQVISARKTNSIRILFCDSGTTSVRQLSELREISDEILRLPQMTVMVQLRNVENYSLNSKLAAFLAKFEEKEFEIRYGAADERGGTAELLHWQTEKCLNEEIVKFSCESSINIYVDANTQVRGTTLRGENSSADDKTDNEAATESATGNGGVNPKTEQKRSPRSLESMKDNTKNENPVTALLPSTGHGPPKQIQKPVMIPPFKKQTLKENAVNVKAIVLDNSCLDFGYIGCIAQSDFGCLLSVQLHLKDVQDTGIPYRPKLDEYCIAKFEEDWYRARVIDIPDDKHYTVVYVDFTNESNLTSEDIRRYPSDLTTDCRTNLCLIDGLPSTLNENHAKFLKKEIVNNTEFTIDKVKGNVEEIILIECRSLIQKMHEQGLF